jgi:hypothetical protein
MKSPASNPNNLPGVVWVRLALFAYTVLVLPLLGWVIIGESPYLVWLVSGVGTWGFCTIWLEGMIRNP